MLTLIRYELKKILGNRAGMVVCLVVLLFLTGLPLVQYLMAYRYGGGQAYFGLDVEAFIKEQKNSHAGVLTEERIEADLAVIEHAGEVYSTSSMEEMESGSISTYSPKEYEDATVVITDDYYRFIQWSSVDWSVQSEQRLNSLEEAAKANVKETVERDNVDGHPVFRTQVEKDYWIEMVDRVAWPLTYGYAGAWSNALSNILLLGIGILAVCIALSGVFSGEYQTRTVAVLLPTRRGKSTLPWAKMAASFIFVTIYWLLITVATLGVHVAVCGMDGWDLPYQLVASYGQGINPYPLTAGQAVLLKYLLGYVMAIGMGGLTLLLSSKLRSTLPVAIIPTALVFAGVLAEVMGADVKLFALAPFATLIHAYEWLLTYAVGSLVVDLPIAVMVLYLVLFAVCVPLATRIFARHQVA